MPRLRIGSRGSQLALWQANHISALLQARGHEVELEIIKTTGDKILDVALAKVGTKGMFTKEIEEALAVGAIDLALRRGYRGLPGGSSLAHLLAARRGRGVVVPDVARLRTLRAAGCEGQSR